MTSTNNYDNCGDANGSDNNSIKNGIDGILATWADSK